MATNNVTTRRRKPFLDISDITTEITQFNSTIADGSLLDVSTKSVPMTLELNTTTSLSDMKQQIIDLRCEMDTAHEEIANLNSYCSSLKKELVEKSVQIELLKKITTDPAFISSRSSPRKTSTTPIMKKLTSIRMSIPRFSPINNNGGGECSIGETPTRRENQYRPIKNATLTSRIIYTEPEFRCKPSSDHKSTDVIDGNNLAPEVATIEKPKIIVLGDQQAKNLTQQLTKDRMGKWNDKYDVFGLIKPSATSSEILGSCNIATLSTNDKDIIILVLGSNDYNPYVMYSNLCNFLCRLNGKKVLIADILENRFLNIKKLNNKIKLLSKNYASCKFIEMSHESLPTHSKRYIRNLSFKINIEINSMAYNEDFLNIDRLKTLCTVQRPTKCSIIKQQISDKGTIPYYFRPVAPSTSTNNGKASTKNKQTFFRE